jgi:flagellar hook assembly protein FlgD
VRTLVEEAQAAGRYVVEWDGRDDRGGAVSSGVYFYRMTNRGFSDVKKMLLIK